MGMYIIRCMLGFSSVHANEFSERLEERSLRMDRSCRKGHAQLLAGLDSLHDAVDAALSAREDACGEQLERGLSELRDCADQLAVMGEELVQVRADLFEREGIDPQDPILVRERFLTSMDYDEVYRELVAHGAALPQRVFWDDVVGRVRDGGARAGLRLFDRHLRELQSDLRTFIGEVGTMRSLPLEMRGHRLHDVSRAVGTLVVGFTRMLMTFSYFSIICDRASHLLDRELAGGAEAMAS